MYTQLTGCLATLFSGPKWVGSRSWKAQRCSSSLITSLSSVNELHFCMYVSSRTMSYSDSAKSFQFVITIIHSYNTFAWKRLIMIRNQVSRLSLTQVWPRVDNPTQTYNSISKLAFNDLFSHVKGVRNEQ